MLIRFVGPSSVNALVKTNQNIAETVYDSRRVRGQREASSCNFFSALRRAREKKKISIIQRPIAAPNCERKIMIFHKSTQFCDQSV